MSVVVSSFGNERSVHIAVANDLHHIQCSYDLGYLGSSHGIHGLLEALIQS